MTVTDITKHLRDPYKERDTIAYSDLQTTFHNERMRDENIRMLGNDMQYDLNRYFKANKLAIKPKEIDDDVFASCYDPNLPTIAIDPETTFTGSELLGLAAHEPETRTNVVYVSSVTDGISIRTNDQDGSSYLEVTHGAFVLPSGQVAYGELPQPIRADTLETADIELLKQAEAASIRTYHSTDTMQRYSDKNILATLATSDIIYAPPRLTKDELLAATTVDNLVIKPSKGSQGRGVLLTDENADAEHAKRFYQFLEAKGYDPVIERRARSYEMIDPKTGERLDWNVRAILSYGDSLGMYVRADKWGEPVNMSISARAISMNDFPDYFPNKETGEELVRLLRESAQALAEENPTSFIGADITIDEDMRACVFELNNGLAGGMQTIAKLEDTYDGVMAIPRKTLAKFMDHTPLSDVADIHTDTSGLVLEPSISRLATAVNSSSERRKLGKLSLYELPHHEDSRYGTVLALMAIRGDSYLYDVFSNSQGPSADDVLIEKYPLEARHYLGHVGSSSFGSTALKRYLNEYEGIIEDDATSFALKAGLRADDFDLDGFSEIARRAETTSGMKIEKLYDFVHPKFLKRFIGPLDDAEPEQRAAFEGVLEDAIATYIEAGYKPADKMLARRIESAGSMTLESRLLHTLRFSMAASTRHFDDAIRYLKQAAAEYDIDDSSLSDYFSEYYSNPTLSEIADMSREELDFQLDLAIHDNNLLPTATDILYCARVNAIDKATLDHMALSIASKTDYEGTDEDRRLLYSLMRKITAEADDEYRDIAARDLNGMSVMAQMTCVMIGAVRGDAKRVNEIHAYYRDNDIWQNGVEVVTDFYIDNRHDWEK